MHVLMMEIVRDPALPAGTTLKHMIRNENFMCSIDSVRRPRDISGTWTPTIIAKMGTLPLKLSGQRRPWGDLDFHDILSANPA
jgi:hypothetical protein